MSFSISSFVKLHRFRLGLMLLSLVVLAVSWLMSASARTEWERADDALSSYRGRIQDVLQFKKHRDAIESFKKDTFTGDNNSAFISRLIGLVNDCSIVLVSVKTSAEREIELHSGPVKVFPVDLRIKGSFKSVYEFLYKLETDDYFIFEEGMIMEKGESANIELRLSLAIPLKEAG